MKQFDNIRDTGVNIYEISSVLSKNGIANYSTKTLIPSMLRELSMQRKSSMSKLAVVGILSLLTPIKN